MGRGLVRDLGSSPLPLPRNWRLGTQRVCRRQPLSNPELVTAKLCSTSEHLHSLPGRGTDREQRDDRQTQTDTHRAEKDRERQRRRETGREGGRGREREETERKGRRDRDRKSQSDREWTEERKVQGDRETERQTETETQRERGTASCEKRGKKDDRQNQKAEKIEPVQEATLQPHANQ